MRTNTKPLIRCGVTNKHRPRWTPKFVARLGREPDRVIAASRGIIVSSVGHKRRSLGIPPLSSLGPRWTRAMIARLGKMSDAAFAATYDIPYLAVAYKRRSLGIQGWRKQ